MKDGIWKHKKIQGSILFSIITFQSPITDYKGEIVSI